MAARGHAGGWVNPLRYGAREYDAETGLYYQRARYYDPQLQRFLSEDPIGLAGGVNLYAYAGGDPVNYRDPNGTCPFREMVIEIDTDTGEWTATCPSGGGSASGTLGVAQLPTVTVTGTRGGGNPSGASANFGNPNARGGRPVGPGGPGGPAGPGSQGPSPQPPQPPQLPKPPRAPQPLPMCTSVEFVGASGTIHVQTSPQGYVQWGITMHNALANDGAWSVQQYVGGSRVGPQMDRPYYPHGSVNPVKRHRGLTPWRHD